MAHKVIITHEISETEVKTTVKLPGQKPISKRWVACDGGMMGKFKLDWEEDPRLAGWSKIARGDTDANYRGLSGIEETKYWPFIQIVDRAIAASR